MGRRAPRLALEGWPERHTNILSISHQHTAENGSSVVAVVAASVATHGGTACKLCCDEDDMQAN